MDLVVNVPRHPQIGETLLGGSFATFPGGKGANQAVAAARMGARVSMIGCVGNDGFGDELLRFATQDGIDTNHIFVAEKEATGIALITVDGHGRNTIVVASGANLSLSHSHLEKAQQVFSEADVLVVQLESPLETVSQAVAMAAQHKTLVILNPAPAQPLPATLLSMVDYLIPNEHEVLQIADADSIETAIDKLLGIGVRHLIITLGEKGALLVSKEDRIHLPAFQVKAIDTVAAGDAFVGGFATGLAEGMELEAAAKLGSAAAAISVTRRGAQPSLPSRKEVNEFLGVS